MNKDVYVEEMRQFSERVWCRIAESLTEGAGNSRFAESLSTVDVILKRRMGKPLQKPFLIKLSAEALGCDDAEALEVLAAAGELLNLSSYQINTSFDNKCGVVTGEQKDLQVIFGMISLDAAYSLIHSTSLHVDKKLNILRLLSDANRSMYRGQYLDLVELTLANGAHRLGHQAFLRRYLKRCDLLSGQVNRNLAAMGAIVADACSASRRQMETFGLWLGRTLQVVNDAGDMIDVLHKSRGKTDYQDKFSDLRNGRVTLPVYLLLRTTERSVAMRCLAVGSGIAPLDDVTRRDVNNVMRTEIGPSCRSLSSEMCKRCRTALGHVPSSRSKQLLAVMATIGSSNVYYHELRARGAYGRAGVSVHPRGAIGGKKRTHLSHAGLS